MTSRGFTLIELMITITILAILLGVGVPSFLDASLSSRLSSIANDLVASVQLARSEAIKRNSNVTVCVSSNGTDCGSGDWNQGWIVLASSEVLLRQYAIPTGYRINSAVSALTFQSTGLGATSNTFKVCRDAPSVGSQERLVSVTAAARASVRRTETGVCP